MLVVMPLVLFILILIYLTYTMKNKYQESGASYYDPDRAQSDAYFQSWQTMTTQEKQRQENLGSDYRQSDQALKEQWGRFKQEQDQIKFERRLSPFGK